MALLLLKLVPRLLLSMKMVVGLVMTSKPSLLRVCFTLSSFYALCLYADLYISMLLDPDGETTVVEREEGWFGDDVTVTQTDEYGNTTVVSKEEYKRKDCFLTHWYDNTGGRRLWLVLS